MLHRCFVDCHPGSRPGDTEGLAARWQCPVASGVALNILNWVMSSILIYVRPRGGVHTLYNHEVSLDGDSHVHRVPDGIGHVRFG